MESVFTQYENKKNNNYFFPGGELNAKKESLCSN